VAVDLPRLSVGASLSLPGTFNRLGIAFALRPDPQLHCLRQRTRQVRQVVFLECPPLASASLPRSVIERPGQVPSLRAPTQLASPAQRLCWGFCNPRALLQSLCRRQALYLRQMAPARSAVLYLRSPSVRVSVVARNLWLFLARFPACLGLPSMGLPDPFLPKRLILWACLR
jgi:hypothetical protein